MYFFSVKAAALFLLFANAPMSSPTVNWAACTESRPEQKQGERYPSAQALHGRDHAGSRLAPAGGLPEIEEIEPVEGLGATVSLQLAA